MWMVAANLGNLQCKGIPETTMLECSAYFETLSYTFTMFYTPIQARSSWTKLQCTTITQLYYDCCRIFHDFLINIVT